MIYPDDFINKIVNGDCIEVMGEIPTKSIDLIVTSPPYNLGIRKVSKNASFAKKSTKLQTVGYDSHDDYMPKKDYIRWQRNCLFEMIRVLKDDGAIFYNHRWRVQEGRLEDCSDIMAGLPVRQIIIWKKQTSLNFNEGYFLPIYEVIYLITQKDFKLAPNGNKNTDVWDIKFEKNETGHPAPFPIEVPEKCISSTNAEIILDPFVGSGTTALAAKKLGRKYIGIDISAQYCEIARERVK